MNEIWKEIKGYEGRYEVSNLGNVRAIEKVIRCRENVNRTAYGHIKKKTVLKIGYEALNLWKDGKAKLEYVHRLVAEAFIPNDQNLPVVNHLDGNKANNNVNNLEWCTTKKNIQHAFETNLVSNQKPVICIETGIEYRSETEAARQMGNKNHQSLIGACARNAKSNKTAYGYHWKFK